MSDMYSGMHFVASTPKKQQPQKKKQEHEDFDTDDEALSQHDGDCLDDKFKLASNFVQAVIVSMWDNTVGPKPVRVWKGQNNTVQNDLINFLARFSVIDEITRCEEISNNVEIKFNLLSDAGIANLSIIIP